MQEIIQGRRIPRPVIMSTLSVPPVSGTAIFPGADSPGTGFLPGSGEDGCSAALQPRTSAVPAGFGPREW